MEVRLRPEGETPATPFLHCEPCELDSLMHWIRSSGGVYFEGELLTEVSYQIVLDETGAYVELILA